MNELLESYNNKNIKIILLKKEYSAQLIREHNELIIKLIDDVDRETMLNLQETQKIVVGKIEAEDISFFDLKCNYKETGSNSKLWSLSFKFDMFIEGVRIKNDIDKNFTEVSFQFNSIPEFSTNNFYNFDKHLNPIFNSEHYEYIFDSYKICISSGANTTLGYSVYKSIKKISFSIIYHNSKTIHDIIKDVWTFKCFLSIISKRKIGIKSIILNKDRKLFMSHTYFEDITYKSEFLEHDYKEFILSLEDIKNNFKEIYTGFIQIFNEINPIFDIYIDIIEKKPSRMNRFLNCNQIIEYISKYYDNTNATSVWIHNGKPGGNSITLSSRIESIIKQVNYIWNFDEKRLTKFSKKIGDGRNYYNHHTEEIKKLDDDELYRFSYFLEDIILAFIYDKIGVDKETIKKSLIYNINYSNKDIN